MQIRPIGDYNAQKSGIDGSIGMPVLLKRLNNNILVADYMGLIFREDLLANYARIKDMLQQEPFQFVLADSTEMIYEDREIFNDQVRQNANEILKHPDIRYFIFIIPSPTHPLKRQTLESFVRANLDHKILFACNKRQALDLVERKLAQQS